MLDHLIVGGDAFRSIRDLGVPFDRRTAGRAAREKRGPWWRDPRYGAYKSAVQKYIRRGEVAKAAAATERLGSLPIGLGMLRRRLTVIAAEDVGWRYIPDVAARAEASEGMDDSAARDQLVALAAGLASLPKQKEAFWLVATCWDDRRTAPSVTTEALREALHESRYQDAVAICLAAQGAKRWRSNGRIIDALRFGLDTAPSFAHQVGHFALRREAKGGAGGGELTAAAVIAAIDRPDGIAPVVPTVSWQPVDGPVDVDWYALDVHTALGRRAVDAVARRYGIDAGRLGWLMFAFESILLGPEELPSRWHQECLEMDARIGGWGDQDNGAELWLRYRDEVRSAIEAGLPTLGLSLG